MKSKENKLEQKFESYFIEKNERKVLKFTKKSISFLDSLKSKGKEKMGISLTSSQNIKHSLLKSPT